jgi:hypothetical protein
MPNDPVIKPFHPIPLTPTGGLGWVAELAIVHGGVKERANSREESVVPRQLPDLHGSAGLEHVIADKQHSGMV